MYGYRDGEWSVDVVEPPAAEPISLATAKLHCRVDSGEEDELLELAIAAAREYVESFTRRALVSQTLRLSLDVCPLRELILPRPPLASVVEIAYDDEDGEEQTLLDPPDGYTVRRTAPGRVRLQDGVRCVGRPVR
ncbi:MAG TPA: head-tail connector protein, partial [Pirellulales bacterium]